MNVPKVIEVLRGIMCNTDRPAEERGAAATAIWLLCSDDGEQEQEREHQQQTMIPTPVADLNGMEAADKAMQGFLASLKGASCASN